MRESRVRQEGRKLQEKSFGGHGLGQHALQAGSLRRQLRNASGIMHRAMMAVDRAATVANTAQPRRGLSPKAEDLEMHTFLNSVVSPLTTLLAVSTEEGSYASRFAGAFVKLNELRDRAANAHALHLKRLKRTTKRRLNSPHADALYAALDASAEPEHMELPHSHGLSWVHELVDWPSTVAEGSRLLGIVRARHTMREDGAKHSAIVKAHPTGWWWLDNPATSKPTIVGDAARRVLYRKEKGTDPPWHVGFKQRVARHEGGFRRLGVAFMESTVAAPFTFYDTIMPSGYGVDASEISFWEATLRYVISSTVGCYFVAPEKEASKTQGEQGTQDGDKLTVLRPSEEKLCFPAMPYLVPPIPPFRTYTGTEDVDIYRLSYEQYCSGRGSATQYMYDWIVSWGLDPTDENPLLPNAPLLRTAEALDSILNAASSGSRDVENKMNAGRVLCSIVQLGGLVYFSMLLIVALVLLQCLPFFNFGAQVLFDGCVVATSSTVAAAAAPDLKKADKEPQKRGGRRRVRVQPVGGSTERDSLLSSSS